MSETDRLEVEKLAKHAKDLATAFKVELFLSSELFERDNACAIRHPDGKRRAVLGYPVTDETSYAVVLHELGHHLSPWGNLRYELRLKKPKSLEEGKRYLRLMLEEERAAWDWAKHNALYWTTAMMQVEQLAYGSYERKVTELCR